MEKMTINLHFTDLCNFKCQHCFVNKQQGNELSLKEIKIIIDKIYFYSKENNVSIRINLAGGEPLASKNIQAIIDYIFSKEMEVSIITNGYYLSKDFIENNKNKLSMIGISIDSICDNTNRLIGRCSGNRVLTEENLLKKCFCIKCNGIKLKINTCISSLNKNENLCSFLEKVQPNRFKILRILCENSELSNLLISDKEWQGIQMIYKDLNVIYEDNDYMRENYIIIDSFGNLTKNNLHLNNNSLLSYNFEECLKHLNHAKGI